MNNNDNRLAGIIHHIGYRIIIGWSIYDQCYKAYTPGLDDDIIQPCARGKIYEEVVEEAKEVLGIFVGAISDGESENEQ